MLVAMLALLPNAIWGLTEQKAVNIANGSSVTFTGLNNYITTNDYTAWFVLDASGNNVDITGWSISNSYRDGFENKGTYWVFPKPYYVGDGPFVITTSGTDISQYTIVLLVSSKEDFKNAPSEANAEKKITFQLVSKDKLPTFKTYSGSNSAEKLVTVADANLQGGSISITDLGETLADFGIWDKKENADELKLNKYPFYLRLSVVDKKGNPVTDLSEFKLQQKGTDISATNLDNKQAYTLACYKNAKGIYCLCNMGEYTSVSFSDLNFTISCPSDKNINDYNVVVYVGNEQPSISDNLIMEEPTLVGKVNYTILSQTQFGAIKLEPSKEPASTAVNKGSSIVLGTNLNVDLTSEDNLKFIKEQLGLSETQNFGKLYVRWAIKKKDGSAITGVSSKGALKQQEGMYWTWYSDDASSSFANALNANFVVPEGLDINDVDISCVISDEKPTTVYGFVTTEPTLKAMFKVQLFDKYGVPFKHYKGYTNADYEVINESNGQLRQKTYTWEYTYPVEVGKPVPLTLPLEAYNNNGHPGLEPLGYYRWYNYDTDEASDNIKADTQDTNYLHEISDEKGNKKGLLAYNLGQINPWQGNIGVNYTRPNDNNWKGETIACDVSRYIDGMDATGSYLEHESTLSIRYIFHLIPAKQMADMEKDYLTNSENDLTYEDNKNVTVGFANTTSAMTLRLNMKPTMYYFYPMTNPKHHVYFPTGQPDRDIVAEDFGKELKKATKVIWRIYNGDKNRYFERESNVSGFPRFFDVSQDVLNSASAWKDLDGKSVTGNITFNYGDHFSVVAYAVADDNSSCPIANFNCRFFGFHPMMDSEMGNVDVQRKISYLEENYNRVAMISFDNDSPEQTLSYPTNDMDNQSEHPSDWSKRSYGFVYKNLLSKSVGYTGSPNWYDPLHSPLHGEYGIYKTANVKGVSSDKYMWYDNSQLHDRTWESTGKSQTGSFLYVDASDESRTIASAEFSANLCTGQQMAFSAYVADMTEGTKTQPQLMFKLFGLVGNQKVLLHSFSSGDFMTNRDSYNKGKWYQVFGKITIQQEAHAELYDNFRIEIDNYSKGTNGADYAVDDIRIYSKPAKIEVYQDRPACGSSTTGNIKLKVRAIHETLNALLGHKNTTIHFRFVNEDGSPVNRTGFYNYMLKKPGETVAQYITTDKDYASVDVFDSEETCAKYEIDGVSMIETDADGERYIILANHQFALEKGKKYYVSVCTDSNPDAADAKWGKPSDVCSIYSDLFELIGQTPAITDADGKVITEYRVGCAEPNPSVTLKGSLTTIDPKTGAKITLTDVPFFWYIDQATKPYSSTASKEISIPISSEFDYGAHTVYMKPEPTGKNAENEDVYTIGSVSYLLCDEAIPVTLRIAKDGPRLNFGFNDVDYPFNDNSYEASLRIGLPQLKKLKEKSGYLQVPIHDVSYLSGVTAKTLTFIDDSKTEADKTSADVFVATTNDPLWNAEGATLLSTPVATLSSKTLEVNSDKQYTLDLKFSYDVLEHFHEGYYYELRFVFEQQSSASEGTTNCPGEAYLKMKIVPEFITWTPTADGGMNANWNNDDNWHRSSSTELYNNEYTNYLPYGSSMSGTPASAQDIPTMNSYVPMKFTKVTIDNLNGLPFPDLGNIVYRSTNQIATKLTNGKGNEATKYIQYDIMAYWDEAAANKGLESGNLKCEKFYGNTCYQIYFKPQGELRDQCYLIYDKAWVEKELVPNKWYTMASPLQYIYAGDMYVPASNGRQETKAFTGINYNDKVAGSSTSDDAYSRSKYPVYQRAWMKSDVKEITSDGEHDAWHKPSGEASKVDVNLGYWSHVYNKVNECYTGGSFGGFAIKAGNALLPKDQTKNALLRLPKEDTSYQYFDYNGTVPSGGKESDVNKPEVSAIVSSEKNSTGHGKLLVAFNNDEKHLAEMTQSLGTDNNSGFYLVANPYTCSISLKKFFEVNTGLQQAVWVVDGDNVRSKAATDLADKDFFIQPTQSFFVKKNGTTSVDAVKFTSAMYVDRLLSAGVIIAPGYLTNVNVSAQNAKGQTSKARIAVREEASDDYDEQEDVDLLCDQNLSGIPQVYTVAGSQAVAVNATPKIEWMPMGVIMENGEKNEMVSLDFKGVAKLDAPLYLYDAANGQYTELQDGNEVSIQANEHGRYFLTQTRGTTGIQQIEAEAESNQLKVYSPAAGMIVVSALNGEKLGRVEVFTLDGKMVHSYQLPDKQRMILRVPSGVYIVKASTQSCAQAKGLKVAVR